MSGTASTTAAQFFTPSLSNGNFTQIYLGSAASGNNTGIIKFTQDATTSTLGLQMFGDSFEGLSLAKGGTVTLVDEIIYGSVPRLRLQGTEASAITAAITEDAGTICFG
jgi:hypothetical protein